MNQISAFFSRIGLPADTTVVPNLAFLGQIQTACVLTIPYENLDLLARKPLSLAPADVFRKIVLEKRGGYCFELNGLLHYVLAEMGFSVSSRLARFLRGESEIPFGRHRIVIVTLDGAEYMMDIGVGQIAPRLPLKLEAGLVQEQNGETYRFEKDTTLGWILWELHKGEWRRYLSFTDVNQFEVDFTVPSFWCENHPDSPFLAGEMLAIKTLTGRKTISGHEYREFVADDCICVESNMSDERLAEVMRTEFSL